MKSATCTQEWWETPDTKSFLLKPADGQPFRFKAGQFVFIRVNIHGRAEQRAYTLGPASNRQRLHITVKRVCEGIVSNWLLDHFHTGDHLMISGATGDFCFENRFTRKKLLMLSAGCGIVPVCSVATEALRINPQQDICFIQCAKNKQYNIYHQLLIEYTEGFQNVDLNLFLKEELRSLSALKHRLNEETLPELCPDLHERLTYLCGPVQFVASMKQALAHLDYDLSLLHQENIQTTSV